MPINSDGAPELFAKWLVNQPRLMAVATLLSRAFFGTLVGLVIGLLIPAVASRLDDELLLFVVGVAILVLSKIVGQLFWVTKLRPWAPLLIRPVLRRLGIPHDEDFEVPLELSSKLSLTVTVVATTGIATILATDYVPGGWIASFAAGPWIPAVAGALIAPLNTLSSPTTQYILWHNSYPHQKGRGD